MKSLTVELPVELRDLNLWDLPTLLAQYRIPWFDYGPDDLERDLAALREAEHRNM